jgi:hypothetical protein
MIGKNQHNAGFSLPVFSNDPGFGFGMLVMGFCPAAPQALIRLSS